MGFVRESTLSLHLRYAVPQNLHKGVEAPEGRGAVYLMVHSEEPMRFSQAKRKDGVRQDALRHYFLRRFTEFLKN